MYGSKDHTVLWGEMWKDHFKRATVGIQYSNGANGSRSEFGLTRTVRITPKARTKLGLCFIRDWLQKTGTVGVYVAKSKLQAQTSSCLWMGGHKPPPLQ